MGAFYAGWIYQDLLLVDLRVGDPEEQRSSEIRVWVSYAEIYQEQIKDLLSVDGVGEKGSTPPKLEVSISMRPVM